MNKNQDIDNSVVDWAYGDMEKSDAEAFEAKLQNDGELRAEAEAMKKVLGSYTQHKIEVEPPRSLRESLLLEAAKEASQKKQGGMLAWLNSVLIGNPGVMAMASLALVVGVAGAMYSKGSLKFADMNETQDEPSSMLAADDSLASVKEDKITRGGTNKLALDAESTKGRTANGVEGGVVGGALEGTVGGVLGGASSSKDSLVREQKQPLNKKRFKGAVKKKTSKKMASKAYRPSGPQDPLEDLAFGAASDADNAKNTPSTLSRSRRTPAKSSNAPAPAAAMEKYVESANDDVDAYETVAVKKPQAPKKSEIKNEESNESETRNRRTLLRDFTAAVNSKKKSCANILRSGRAIKKIDLEYYKIKVAKNKSFVSCSKSSK